MPEFVVKTADFVTSAVNPKGWPEEGPPEIAFAGRSNVGKSSLINKILNRRKLVKVSSRPGRTQQINFFDINQGELGLVDLPGYGFAKVPAAVKKAWKPMMESYLSGRQSLCGVVVILDVRRDPNQEDLMLLGWLASLGVPPLVVVTKADKLSKNKAASRLAYLRKQLAVYDPKPVLFSSLNGQGVDDVWIKIIDAIEARLGEYHSEEYEEDY